MFNDDPKTRALLEALGAIPRSAPRERSPIVQAMMSQMLTQQHQPQRISSYGQLAAELGTAFLQKRALDKALEAEGAQRQQSEQVQREIARTLMGGGNPDNQAASAYNAANPGELGMVQTTPQKMPDPDSALLQAALNPAAMQGNPMLSELLKREATAPDLLNVPSGGVLVDPRTRRPVYSNPVTDRASQAPSTVREFEYARERDDYKGSFIEFLKSGRGSSSDQPTSVREFEYAKASGYQGSYTDFLRSSKASADFKFRASDANAFRNSSAQMYGGFYDPVSGQFSGLDDEKAQKAARLSADAARIYREAEGDLSHNEAFMDAFSRQKRNQPQATPAPPAAVEHLKKNPHLKDAFKQKYGYLPEDL